MNSIKDLKPTAIWQNFYKLTQVPRPSNHENKPVNLCSNGQKRTISRQR